MSLHIKDICILIQNNLEDCIIYEHDWSKPYIHIKNDKHEVAAVTIADKQYPILHISNGQKFQITITAL